MFESVTFENPTGKSGKFDLGSFAEALIFYGSVNIVGNGKLVRDVLAGIGPFHALTLISDGRLKFFLQEHFVGVQHEETNIGRLHSLMSGGFPDDSIEKGGPRIFKDVAGATGQARVGASRFTKSLSTISLQGFDQLAVLDALENQDTILESTKAILAASCPLYSQPDELVFRINRVDKRYFQIETNIDFGQLDARVPNEAPWSAEGILAAIQGAYEATFIGASVGGDLAVGEVTRAIQSSAIDAAINRRIKSEAQLARFQELTLGEMRAIRKAVNCGAVSFRQVMQIVEKGDKFRDWLRTKGDDAQVVRNYHDAVTKSTWAEALGTKIGKFSVFAGAGVAVDVLGAAPWGTLGGVALGAFENFVVDSLIKGWRPSQFVTGELQPTFRPDIRWPQAPESP